MLGLEKHSILESFTSLSSEFIIPWSNTNIKWGFFNMLVRHGAAGHLYFGGNRHRGVSKAAQNMAGDFLPLWIQLFLRREKSSVWCFSVLWLLSVAFCFVPWTMAQCHLSLGSINTSLNDIILRHQARPGLGNHAFIRKHESCHWNA